MTVEIKVPAVGESISEVFIGEWYVKEGGWIETDGNLVGLETDKATFDVPAPSDGKITKILKRAGETASVGEVIAHFEAAPRPAGTAPAKAPAPVSTPAPSKSAGTTASHTMPAAARVLAQSGTSASEVTATGPGGRLLKEDVDRHLSGRLNGTGSGSEGVREERRVPMSPMRQTIARRLVEAQQTAALLTTFNECDLSAIKELRAKYQDAFVKKHGVKLGFMSFFVKAVVDALGAFPAIGAEIDGKELIYRNYCDIGVAIGGGKGLVVPVLRNAERMSLAEIEIAIGEFAARAKENKIGLEELEGGNFTITNGGVYGSLLSTPIVNPPQSGVLGMHGIVDRPVAVNGQVVIRPMMYLALTYDHRVVDGREAVQFLVRIKDVIEDPSRLVLDI
ncbi:MAG: 2-oxoglutarate dehydrogenase complex dihydrolipoyllysine-residue succinyltransferase [Planctomycetaceae bacterium]